MKRVMLLENWTLTQVEPLACPIGSLPEIEHADTIFIGSPKTALEALMEAGRVSSSIQEDGEAEYCEWIAEKDWLYQCSFPNPNGTSVLLQLDGLDTDCEIWLNGSLLAHHHSMYLPLRLSLEGQMQETNQLAVYFHSPGKLFRLYQASMPEQWKGVVWPGAFMRKAPCDLFRNYLGVTPYYAPVGFFGNVALEVIDRGEILSETLDYTLSTDLSSAKVSFSTQISSSTQKPLDLEFRLFSHDCRQLHFQSFKLENNYQYNVTDSFALEDIELWWPIGFGSQPLYHAEFRLLSGGETVDVHSRYTGLRKVELVGSLKFRINGTVIRLWGANLATIGSISHRPDPDKAHFLLQRAVACNCNTLRVWGPGEPLGDDFYLEADRIGMLVWQDFYIEPSQLPDLPQHMDLYLEEARQLVLRLRNHPSILLWCGSNESLHMMDYNQELSRIGAEKLLTQQFPLLCMQLDPDRYYHPSCPCGGEFPNDPSYGDTHGSHCMVSYQPGEEFAVFFSEHIVTFPPALPSLQRFISLQDIWPDHFTDTAVFGRASCFPPALERRANTTTQQKLGPIERFYDATDAYTLIYKLTAAAGYAYYHHIAKLRRGKPAHDVVGPRRSNGYLSWKFNNTWPQFYCGLVDYYGECHIPFYETRRAFSPLLLDFEVGDRIFLWGVNDTRCDISGMLEIKAFRIKDNKVIKAFSCPAAIPAGDSSVLVNLDCMTHLWRDCVLFARLICNGEELVRTNEFLDMERHLAFPPAKIKLVQEGNNLVLTTDTFARCIELSGQSSQGDSFGWQFQDNYFDLLPFEQKRISIEGKHTSGTISAKAHYSPHMTELLYRKQQREG